MRVEPFLFGLYACLDGSITEKPSSFCRHGPPSAEERHYVASAGGEEVASARAQTLTPPGGTEEGEERTEKYRTEKQGARQEPATHRPIEAFYSACCAFLHFSLSLWKHSGLPI